MAQINEEYIVIKVSRIAKTGEELPSVVTKEVSSTICSLVEEILSESGCVVEIESGDK
jgi:hypothetical protein